jgi:hypothetical protein
VNLHITLVKMENFESKIFRVQSWFRTKNRFKKDFMIIILDSKA